MKTCVLLLVTFPLISMLMAPLSTTQARTSIAQANSAQAAGQITAQSAGPITALVMSSQPGDYVGGGVNYSYGPADGTFSAQAFDFTGDGLVDYLEITFAAHNGDFWTLFFGTNALGQNLAVGVYNRSERAPFADPGHPGLDVSGLGRGCDADIGRFAILDAKFDYSSSSPRLVSFAAEFEQHCENMSAALTGAIYINSTPTSSLTFSPPAVQPGGMTQGKVTLSSPAPPAGASVALFSVDTASVMVPASVPVSGLGTMATFAVSTTAAKGPRSVPVLALYNGVASYGVLQVVPPAPPVTMLSMKGDPGDYVGGGQTYLYTPADGVFDVATESSRQDSLTDSLILEFHTPTFSHFWLLGVSTAQLNTPLLPGSYPDSQRWPFEAPGHPGLDISGDGRGCNTDTGNFTVLDTTFDYTFFPARPVTFAIQFVQHCEGVPPALTGTFYYNFAPGPSFDKCLKSDDGTGLLQFNSTTGAYTYTQCATGFTLVGTGTVRLVNGVATLIDIKPDRRVTATVLLGQLTGDATLSLSVAGGVWQTFKVHGTNPNAACSCSSQ